MSSSHHHLQNPHQQSAYEHMNNNISANNSGTHNNAHEYDEFDDGDNEQDFYDDGPLFDDDNMEDSEEDTEEASETEMGSSSNHRSLDEPIEIKEQMYQDKLANLKKQLEELRTGTHPEYIRRVKKLEHQFNERIRLNEIYREYLISCVERDYILEKNAAVKEYEEKKVDLRDNLMTDFEDRRKMIENERATMELTGDSIDVKPTITRKLRRRPNEPLPVPEKRRKPTTGQLVLLLDEKEVENDLKLISRGKPIQAVRPQPSTTSNSGNGSGSQNASSSLVNLANQASNFQMNSSIGSNLNQNDIAVSNIPSSTVALQQTQSNPQMGLNNLGPQNQLTSSNQNNHQSQQPQSNSQQVVTTPQQQQQSQQPLVETRIEDGKLLYERRWFHRGQPVYVEGKDIPRFSANISAIGSEVIWVKKTSDGQKVRIYTNQLSRGKVSIKRRAN